MTLRTTSVRKYLLSLLLLLIGAGILLYTLQQTDAQALEALWPRLNGLYFTALCCLILLSHLLRALRWRQIFEGSERQPRLWTCFISLMAGYLANLVPPRAGEVIRAALLSRFDNIPVEKVLGTVLSERAVDVFTLLVLFVPAVFLSGGELGIYVKQHFGSALSQKSSSLFSPGVLLGLGVSLLLAGIFVALFWKKKLKPFFFSFWLGFTAVFRLQSQGGFWLSTLLIWLCYWAIIILGFLCFSTWPKDWAIAALALMTVGTIGMIVTPGGTVYPLLSSGVLAIFGLKEEEGLLMGWLLWGSQMAIFLIFGAAAFVSLPFVNRAHANDI